MTFVEVNIVFVRSPSKGSVPHSLRGLLRGLFNIGSQQESYGEGNLRSH